MRTSIRHLWILPLWTILVACPTTLCGEDWPTYRHDNTRSGVTQDTPHLQATPCWVWKSSAAPVTAFPGPDGRVFEGKIALHKVRFDDAPQVAISGQRAVFGSSIDGRILCLDLPQGSLVWEFFTGGAIRLAPAIWQGKVYAGSDDGWIYCLDAEKGTLLWKHHAAPAEEFVLARGRMTSRWAVRTGVLIANGTAYFGAGIFPHDRIYHCAVDAVTGEVRWKHDKISETREGQSDASPQGYLLASDKYLFVPQGRDLPAAVNMQHGGPIHSRFHYWAQDAQGDVGGTDALLADGQIYHFAVHQIMAMSQERGDIGFGWLNGRRLVIAGEKGYLADGKRISRFNRMEYVEKSRQHTEKRKRLREVEALLSTAKADPARKEEFEALTHERAKLKQATLTRLIKIQPDWETPCLHEGEMILAGDLLIAGGQKEVAALKADSGEIVWKAPVEGEARGLAAAGDYLLVSTTAGHIYCYGPSTGQPTRFVGPGCTTTGPTVPEPWDEEAKRILALTGIRRGFCLLFGIGDGSLALALARRSDLRIYAVDADADVVANARKLLRQAKLLGERVQIHHVREGRLPHASYFADLAVSQSLLHEGKAQVAPTELLRVLKPGGGVLCLPEEIPQAASAFLEGLRNAGEGFALEKRGERRLLIRKPLAGADWWTHQYGNPGNTASNSDALVRGGLRVLWYGDPGEGQTINRHDGPMAPLCVNGRLFVQGRFALLAYDAYNGLFLWQRENPKARMNGVKGDFRPSNIAADERHIFMVEEDRCFQLDAATGEEVHTYHLPPSENKEPRHWGVVGVLDGVLFGSSVLPHNPRMQWTRLAYNEMVKPGDRVFAYDTRDHRHLWTYQGKSVQHSTVAAGDGSIFFVDSNLTPEQREEILREPKEKLAKLTGDAKREAEAERKRRDLRLTVALDVRSGTVQWKQPIDVTDCSGIGIAAGALVMMYSQGKLVLGGSDSNGHYWEQFLKGEFQKRRLAVLDARTGKNIWAKAANYRIRPIILGDRIYAEPWAYRLVDGELCTRINPETKKPEIWEFNRPGSHCGIMTGAPHMLLFRAWSVGFYDLDKDAGAQWLPGHRLGCWANAIPAGGLVLIPESSAGCHCLFPITCTVVLEPAAGYPRTGKPIWRHMDTYLNNLRKQLGLEIPMPADKKL